MKKFVFLSLITMISLGTLAQERGPAGNWSGGGPRGEPGGGGSNGGNGGKTGGKAGKDGGAAAGRATYERERSEAADRGDPNRGMNNDNVGGTPAGARDAGTSTARETGTQNEMDRENGKTQGGRELIKNDLIPGIENKYGIVLAVIAVLAIFFGVARKKRTA